MTPQFKPDSEWIETDGLGGFASGTAGGARTRRYHGLLLAATQPPTGRIMLVNGFDAWIGADADPIRLSAQKYAPDVTTADPRVTIESFSINPWPTWIFRLSSGARIRQEIFARHAAPLTAVSWTLIEPVGGSLTLCVRPFLSGRDYHSLHHENGALQFEPRQRTDGCTQWQTYPDLPAINACSNGAYRHDPHWYRNFLYEQEQQRGLDDVEDLAAPGVFTWDLAKSEAVLLLAAGEAGSAAIPLPEDAVASLGTLRVAERKRRKTFATPLDRSADQYLVKRGDGKTIVAGYPWFTDWGRDTFIAMRGLCFATGRFDEARNILLEWADAVSNGMLPNRFPDHGQTPEFNAVDASLWYVVAVHEFLSAAERGAARVTKAQRTSLETAVREILTGYERGTRFNIRVDEDGLLAAGEPGVQLTWMDAKVGDWVVTPRIGKPVEIQALWLNALWSARHLSDHWTELFVRGRDSFRSRFWSDVRGHLYDVIDCDHKPGIVDARFRPNQILAIGGLPIAILENGRARRVVDEVERQLWTPLGLRSLSPDDLEYAGHYRGGVRERDGAYHQGTVWPWLIGPFVEAWLRVRGNRPDAKREARQRFLAPLLAHLNDAGLGHVCEVADGESPHLPGGCPFQAWSLSELIRLQNVVLADQPVTTESTSAVTARTFGAAPQPAFRNA